VPGFDLTFSAPKSVSVLWALSDDRTRGRVRECHERAVDAALGYMEREAAAVRRGAGGRESLRAGGLVGAAFRHRTSRAGDPQLHTHVLVANLGRAGERWTALDGARLYRHAKTGGYLYQAELRARLARELGVEWGPVRRGAAEIAGIPDEVLRGFSRRRSEIEARMRERGTSSARGAQVAALDSRRAKDYGVGGERLGARWASEAKELGFSHEALGAIGGREVASSRSATPESAALGAELTARRSTFDRREVVQRLCERADAGGQVEAIEYAADGFLESGVAVRVDSGEARTAAEVIRLRGGRPLPIAPDDCRYSTADLIAIETRLVKAATAGRGAGRGVSSRAQLDAALGRHPALDREQREMVRRLVTDGDAVAVVRGRAGTGKTYALAAAREAWRAAGMKVDGVALTRSAAGELEAKSGIRSNSVAGFLAEQSAWGAELVWAPPAGGVLVVDEAAMLGTRQLDALHRIVVERGNGKLVLVGDDMQLPEIDAGGAFRALARRGEAIELSQVRRQRDPLDRETLELIRSARGAEALTSYAASERITVAEGAEEVRNALVADWWRAFSSGEDAVMIARRRVDVRDLNDRARQVMGAAGRLGELWLDVEGETIHAGDVVTTRLNAQRLGVANQERWRVEAVNPEARRVNLAEVGGKRTASLDREYLEGRTPSGEPTVELGYAATIHITQGRTVESAYVLATDDLSAQAFYTAASRARGASRMYAAVGEEPERAEIAPLGPRVGDELEGLRRAVEHDESQAPAIDVALEEKLRRRSTDELLAEQARVRPHTKLETERIAATRLSEVNERMERGQSLLDRLDERASASGPAGRAGVEAQRNQLREQLAALREERARLAEETRAREAPVSDVARQRAAAIDAELTRRRRAKVAMQRIDPSPYVEEALGARPDSPRARALWEHSVDYVELYRQRYGVRDPARALGPRPRGGGERAAWEATRQRLSTARQTLEAHGHVAAREHVQSLEIRR
jgi:conjugative relaxase-like TrwC/TraI family protein